MHSAFQYDQYIFRRQVIALDGKFSVYNQNGMLTLYSRQKMFRLKEGIRVYTDESCTQVLLDIQARHISGFSAAYEVTDRMENKQIGVLLKKGLTCYIRDELQLLDEQERYFAILSKDCNVLAPHRRSHLGRWLPQRYSAIHVDDGSELANLHRHFSLFGYYLTLNFRPNLDHRLDRRLGIAAALLLGMIEGRQE